MHLTFDPTVRFNRRDFPLRFSCINQEIKTGTLTAVFPLETVEYFLLIISEEIKETSRRPRAPSSNNWTRLTIVTWRGSCQRLPGLSRPLWSRNPFGWRCHAFIQGVKHYLWLRASTLRVMLPDRWTESHLTGDIIKDKRFLRPNRVGSIEEILEFDWLSCLAAYANNCVSAR